jgi:hypothetical protein
MLLLESLGVLGESSLEGLHSSGFPVDGHLLHLPGGQSKIRLGLGVMPELGVEEAVALVMVWELADRAHVGAHHDSDLGLEFGLQLVRKPFHLVNELIMFGDYHDMHCVDESVILEQSDAINGACAGLRVDDSDVGGIEGSGDVGIDDWDVIGDISVDESEATMVDRRLVHGSIGSLTGGRGIAVEHVVHERGLKFLIDYKIG